MTLVMMLDFAMLAFGLWQAYRITAQVVSVIVPSILNILLMLSSIGLTLWVVTDLVDRLA